jgi:LuxR family maltose regulon positive regulatory protein
VTTLDDAGPLLETKLYIPKPRRGLVPRPRLSERLSRGAESKLTLISAPAGFGKTTLLAEWLAAAPADQRSVAWLALDQGDNQPGSFWAYLIAALQTVAPAVGASALSLLRSAPSPIEPVLATLLNDLSAGPNNVVLVVDDYHLVDEGDIGDGMVFLVEHLPPQVHLVITTRADPALPLARLRARGELVEIRAADLRFTADEASGYLNGVMDLALTGRDVAALEARTEGWIAALQLAALSMQGRDDVAGFIAGFAGDDRYIFDYLVEEVLQRQSEAIRSFLLDTSILDRLTGPLCDAVTDQRDGKATLEALDRANLFLVPLDDRRRWYRYHQLFADVLRARLLDERGGRVPELHRRASAWYEQHGDRPEAIRHALAAEDSERAADLIELAIPAMSQARQEATLRRWIDAIPDELFEARPVLAVGYVAMRLVSGQVEGVEARLRQAERWLEPGGRAHTSATGKSTEMVVVDEAAFRRLPGSIAMYRTALARARGDVAGTITHATQILDVVGEDAHLERGGAAGFLGLAYWSRGDLDAAERWWIEAAASLEKAGHLSDVIGSSIALADIRITQGRLSEAMRTYRRGIEFAAAQSAAVLRGVSDMHVGMSELFRERNDLVLARQHLQSSEELGEQAALAQNPYRWRVAMARVREAEGDLDAAVELLDEAERLYASDYYPSVRPIPALKARVWIAQGRLAHVVDWASEHRVSIEDELSYLREFDHITLARSLLVRSRRDGTDPSVRDALGLLERLLRAAEQGGRGRSVIEILVLQAIARDASGDHAGALASLDRAVVLAEPEGYVRIFVDEWTGLASLLQAIATSTAQPAYVNFLLGEPGTGDARGPRRQPLIEPLSERELDVLRLLATDLAGPEIAGRLFVSLNTVRTHTKNIYAKLGVNNRRAAVRRAEDLGLLSRARDR